MLYEERWSNSSQVKTDFYPFNDQRSKNITHSVRAHLLLLGMAA